MSESCFYNSLYFSRNTVNSFVTEEKQNKTNKQTNKKQKQIPRCFKAPIAAQRRQKLREGVEQEGHELIVSSP